MQVSFVLLFVAVLIVAWVIAASHDRKKVKLREMRRAAKEKAGLTDKIWRVKMKAVLLLR